MTNGARLRAISTVAPVATSPGDTPVDNRAAASSAIWSWGSFADDRSDCCTAPYTAPANTVETAAIGNHNAIERRTNGCIATPLALRTLWMLRA